MLFTPEWLAFLKKNKSKIKKSLGDFCLLSCMGAYNYAVINYKYRYLWTRVFAIVFKIRLKYIVLECSVGIKISDGREW